MNVLMLTNTFTPHVGGVARSVEALSRECRQRGHRVLVVAPDFDDMPAQEIDVVRVPAVQNFNGSNFSVPMPVPGLVTDALAGFTPDVVHSHHPFLLGDTALRVAALYNVPVVFTHHTLYDQYTHYLGGDSPVLQRIAIDLASGYCNLCQGIIAPSQSVADMLRSHQVETPIEVVPTGVDVARFAAGDGAKFRERFQIPAEVRVVGHVGRLAPEKNLGFLTAATIRYLQQDPQAWFVVVGSGPSEAEIREQFARTGLNDRLRLTGVLQGNDLADAYRSFDVFAFASQSETQGLVLAEAMAAGVPVVALDGPGVRDVVTDGHNGRLLESAGESAFADALGWTLSRKSDDRQQLCAAVQHTAEQFSLASCTDRVLQFYDRLRDRGRGTAPADEAPWQSALRWMEREWQILSSHARVVGNALAEAVSSEDTTW